MYPKQGTLCFWCDSYMEINLLFHTSPLGTELHTAQPRNKLHHLTSFTDTGTFPVLSRHQHRWMTYVQNHLHQQIKGQRKERWAVHCWEHAAAFFQINEADKLCNWNVFCGLLYFSSKVKLCYTNENELHVAHTFERQLPGTSNAIFTCSVFFFTALSCVWVTIDGVSIGN